MSAILHIAASFRVLLRRIYVLLRRSTALLRRNIEAAKRRQVSPQAGFALLVVVVSVSVLGAIVGEFGYNARVEMESAANARDELRAEYLARSGINLARILIKLQGSVIDNFNRMGTDIQITDFAPFILKAFGGSGDDAEALTGLLGITPGSVKGLGAGKDGSFDVAMGVEDGKININCGGGLQVPILPPGAPQLGGMGFNPTQTLTPPGGQAPAQNLYLMLLATMMPQRYNRLFQNEGPDGQFVTREEVASAIIDWSDIDEQKFSPMGASGGNEDYHYDQLKDPYKAHNHFYDTVEEVNLVRGVGDDFWGSFGELFTVYGRCQVNLRAVTQNNWPITAAIIRAAAADKNDPTLLDDTVISALSQQLAMIMMMPATLMSTDAIAKSIGMGAALPSMPQLNPAASAALGQIMTLPFPGLPGVKINNAILNQIAKVGPREVYRIDSTGSICRAGDCRNDKGKKTLVHIRAVFDTMHVNGNTTSIDMNDRVGTWVYWRME